jgi:phage-related baseplate assembly protein
MRTTADIYAELRDRVTDLSPVPVRLDRYESIESAVLFAWSEAAYRVEQVLQLARDSISADTAVDGALTQIARRVGITRRAASSSRYETVVPAGQSGTLAGGEAVRGGGPTGRAEWTVITTGTVTAGDPVIIEAVEPGPLALGAGTTDFTLVTTVPGLTDLEWTDGVQPAGQVGQARETDAQLAVRIAQGGSGVRSRILDLDWITLADPVTTGPGAVTLTIAPEPSGADQESELADAVGPYTYGVTYSGADSVTYQPEGATAVTIGYDVAGTASAPVALTVTLAPGVTLADVSTAVEAAVLAYATTLGPGDDAIRTRVIAAALTVDGVEDVTVCTINTNPVNYSPPVSSDVVVFASVAVTT